MLYTIIKKLLVLITINGILNFQTCKKWLLFWDISPLALMFLLPHYKIIQQKALVNFPKRGKKMKRWKNITKTILNLLHYVRSKNICVKTFTTENSDHIPPLLLWWKMYFSIVLFDLCNNNPLFYFLYLPVSFIL